MKKLIAYLVLTCLASLCFAQDKEIDQSNQNLCKTNLIIVFDASGSMEEKIPSEGKSVQKIVAAKQALKKVIAKISNETNVGLFIFGKVVNTNPVPIGPKDQEKLFAAIDATQPGGGTPLGEFINKAANQILQQREKQFGYGRYRILVVTDGEASDPDVMKKVAPEVLRRNIALDAIGVGMTQEHALAKMSSSYQPANDTKALDNALATVVAETGSRMLRTVATGSEDDFAVISHLTDEQAIAVVTKLQNSPNQPLFEKPKSPEPVKSSLNVTTQSSQTAITQATSPPNTFMSIKIILIIIGIVIAIIFIASILSN